MKALEAHPLFFMRASADAVHYFVLCCCVLTGRNATRILEPSVQHPTHWYILSNVFAFLNSAVGTMNTSERQFMELAIEAARGSKGHASEPRVGAVAVVNGQIVGTAYRGQIAPGQHAEFILLAKHLEDASLAGATVYTTLEPCTVRNPPKVPCVERLIQRKVGKVVIGMLDPNPLVRGLGYRKLRQAGITVEMFSGYLMTQLEELNRDFIQAIETNAVHQATQEIAELATRSGTCRQREAAGAALRGCLDSLRCIHSGQIRIPGREGGYFTRLLECIDQAQKPEQIKAFIRLTAFEPEELIGKSWFERFYTRLDEAVRNEKLVIEYIFLLRSAVPMESEGTFLSRYERFAKKIGTLSQLDSRVSPESLRPSIVLLETQQIAFTHDRGDDSTLLEATEWISQEDYRRLHAQFNSIELISTEYFRREKEYR